MITRYISTTHGYYRAYNCGIGDWNDAKEDFQSWLNHMFPERNEKVLDIQ